MNVVALYKVYYIKLYANKYYDAHFFNILPPLVLVFFVLTEMNWKLANIGKTDMSPEWREG